MQMQLTPKPNQDVYLHVILMCTVEQGCYSSAPQIKVLYLFHLVLEEVNSKRFLGDARDCPKN